MVYERRIHERKVPMRDGQILGYVHSTESFGAVDGPGIRFVVFMQGCNMRCQFCHNPDTWKKNVGTEMTTAEVLNKALPYRQFWGTDGGITLSGGEILLQIDFAIELFTKCKQLGIGTCLDTCGQPFTRRQPWFSKFEQLMKVTDILLVDIKHINSDEHRKLTGYRNENILDMCKYLSDIGKPVWIRHVLIPARTDFDNYLAQLGDYIKTLKMCKRSRYCLIIRWVSTSIMRWGGLNTVLKVLNHPHLSESKMLKNSCMWKIIADI